MSNHHRHCIVLLNLIVLPCIMLGSVSDTIAIISSFHNKHLYNSYHRNVMHDRLLMYDSLPCSFFNMKKPPPKPNCAVCSSKATIKSIHDSEESLQCARGPSCSLSNNGSSNNNSNNHRLSKEQHISCQDYNQLRQSGTPHILLDVRVPRQYEMCSLDNSINIPLEELPSKLNVVDELSNGELPVYCLCRRGVASMEATRMLQEYNSVEGGGKIAAVYNIDGGLNEWVRSVDEEFPWY